MFTVTSIAGLMTWFGICVTYIRFYKGFKAQGFDRKTLPYASALQPYAAWYASIACIIICFVSHLFINVMSHKVLTHRVYSLAVGPFS